MRIKFFSKILSINPNKIKIISNKFKFFYKTLMNLKNYFGNYNID